LLAWVAAGPAALALLAAGAASLTVAPGSSRRLPPSAAKLGLWRPAISNLVDAWTRRQPAEIEERPAFDWHSARRLVSGLKAIREGTGSAFDPVVASEVICVFPKQLLQGWAA
jgi:hypothetical protein